MTRGVYPVELVETKDGPRVKITLKEKSVVWAWRDQKGRIRYDEPAKVARHLRGRVVPELFKQFDARRFGVVPAADTKGRS